MTRLKTCVNSVSLTAPTPPRPPLIPISHRTTINHVQVDFLYNVNSSREVGVLNSMDPRAKMELQLWASYRAQTMARTVRGMMYYEQALRLLAVVRAKTFFFLANVCSTSGRQGTLPPKLSSSVRHGIPALSSAFVYLPSTNPSI